jgi:hypothetical protein
VIKSLKIRQGAALAAALLATASVAQADDIGVLVTGDAAAQPRLTAQIEGWLRAHGHTLAGAALPPDAVDSVIDCYAIDDASCAARVVDAHATAKALVFVDVDVEAADGARTVTLRGHWLAKDHAPVTEIRTCEACTDEALRTTAAELIATLSERATPPAAATPAPVAAPLALTAPPPAKPSRVLPYALVGGGAALLVTGIALVAISEDDTGDSPRYYDGRNRAAGFTLGALGLAAASAGAYLYVRSTRAHAPDAVPSVAIVPGGAYVGWARAF